MKYAIDYGHCLRGADTGAIGNGLKEQEVTRDIGRRATAKLRSLGHVVIEVAPDSANSVTESLAYRSNTANGNNVDMFISLHVNAGGGLGTEIYTYNGKEITEARNILNNLVGLGFRNRDIKDGSHLYVIKNTKSKAMLVEMFFIDTDDAELYRKVGAENMANAICKGITGNNTNTTTKPVQATYKPQPRQPQTWKLNISGDIIKRLQIELNRQCNANLKVDGYCGDSTINKLIMVKKGARGNITKIIQELLIRKGYSIGKYGADGIFGNATYNAVCALQRDNKLGVDGIVGKNTWKALLRA